MLAAGVRWLPMSILSLLLPLLIPAVLLMAHSTPARLDPRDLAVPMVFAFVLVGALAVLVFHQDPVTSTSSEGGGGRATSSPRSKPRSQFRQRLRSS